MNLATSKKKGKASEEEIEAGKKAASGDSQGCEDSQPERRVEKP